jgi:hypothetical protein
MFRVNIRYLALLDKLSRIRPNIFNELYQLCDTLPVTESVDLAKLMSTGIFDRETRLQTRLYYWMPPSEQILCKDQMMPDWKEYASYVDIDVGSELDQPCPLVLQFCQPVYVTQATYQQLCSLSALPYDDITNLPSFVDRVTMDKEDIRLSEAQTRLKAGWMKHVYGHTFNLQMSYYRSSPSVCLHRLPLCDVSIIPAILQVCYDVCFIIDVFSFCVAMSSCGT